MRARNGERTRMKEGLCVGDEVMGYAPPFSVIGVGLKILHFVFLYLGQKVIRDCWDIFVE